ncbi:MAG: LacI family DNA-binding transcriptional regulator [Pseudomonadota bacterium]
MRDVARQVGVSPMTVSRALRDDEAVSAETRAKIQKVAQDLGYVYDTTATALRTNKSGFVAVLLPSLNNANFASTFKGLSGGLEGTSLQLLLGSTNYVVEKEQQLVAQLLTRNPEAMVLTGGFHTDETRDLLTRRAITIVETWDMPETPLGHVVGFRNGDAMREIVTHLAETGRKKLAFVGAREGGDRRGLERRRGVIETAEALGLPEVEILEVGDAPVTMTNGEEAVTALGKTVTEFDALVCVSDPVAFGCLCACRRLGIDVPTDLAITGFGNFELAKVSAPRITTVDVNATLIGKRTAELLRVIFETDEPTAPEQHDVGYSLVIGETT